MAKKENKEKKDSKGKKDTGEKVLTVCSATQKMIDRAREKKVSTVFDRAASMKPCPIGADGSCCKNCSMGPCRVPPP